jgi:magnesium transporter
MSEFSGWTAGIPWPVSYSLLTVGLGVIAWLTWWILKRFIDKPIKVKRR